MEPITFDRTCYRIAGRPIYLNSGEFHYFRVPKLDWRRRMELFKEAGGNCLATYIPWILHEPEEGAFLFDTGDGTTDLEEFLQTAHAAGLYVTARPGPYQYSELIYGGLPPWLFDRYPEVQALTFEGQPFGLPSVSYLHPTFLEKTRAWFAAVCPILARYTTSAGGPIPFVQIDNELTGIHIWFGGLDYHPVSMGFGDPKGRYPRFLGERYASVDALNQAYQTDYASFAAARPLSPHLSKTGQPSEILRLRDYFEFYLHATTEYARLLFDLVREFGIDTPIIHNSANPGMNTYFLELVEVLGAGFLLGSDHYYNLSQSWPQNNPTPQYARNVFLSNEELRLMGFPPTVLELPSGSASDWPPITAGDAKACYMANLAYGMKGHNYYVFTGGPNPPGVGETTDSYDYGAPIGAEGQIRDLYHAQVAFGKVLTDYPWLVEADGLYDCRIGLSMEYARAERYWTARGDFLFTPAEARRFLAEGLLTTGLCAGLSPTCVDLATDGWTEETGTPVLVAAADSMARGEQERIVRFLESGGQALIAPILPRFDENLQPCTLLRDFLNGPTLHRSAQAVMRVTVKSPDGGEVANVLKNEAFRLDHLPEGAEILAYDACTGAPLACEIQTSGQGRAILLGLVWDHRKLEQSAALLALLDKLGLRRIVLSSNPNVWTSLRAHRDRKLLFLLNLLSSPMKTWITIRTAEGNRVNLGMHQIPAMTVQTVEVDV
jgi:beta-galactosidase